MDLRELRFGIEIETVKEESALTPILAKVSEHEKLSDRVLLFTDQGESLLKEAVGALPDTKVLLRPANLEDVFLKLTGRAF